MKTVSFKEQIMSKDKCPSLVYTQSVILLFQGSLSRAN